MKKDGPPAPSLSERMRQTIANEKELIELHRSETEATMAAERSRLAASLRDESSRALSAMRQHTDETLSEMQRLSASSRQVLLETEAEIRSRSSAALRGLWPTIIASAAVIFSAAAILIGTTWWTVWDLSATRDQLAIERKALSDIEALTGRVSILNASNGTFVILPRGTEMTTVYDCDGRSCLKLPGR